jgi:hypothetical protein
MELPAPAPAPAPAPVQEPPYRDARPTTPFEAAGHQTYATPTTPAAAGWQTYATPAAPAETGQQNYATPTEAGQQNYATPAVSDHTGQPVYGWQHGQYAAPSTPYDPPREAGRGALTEPVWHSGSVSEPGAPPVRHETEPSAYRRSAYGRRAPALFAAIAAVLAAVIAVVALVVVLAQRGGQGGDSNVPTLGGGPAPTDVRLRDYGSSIQIYWSDPANGTTSFIVTGGHPREVLKPMGQVSPGQTSFGLNGLNADLDYCFAVVAVYSTKDFSSSPQACTSRSKVSARPSTTR